MRLDFSQERILAVVAHPDDAELLCAGTLARAGQEGAAVAVCVLCEGDKGQPAVPIDDLAAVRRVEMQKAAAVLGAALFTGGVPDSTLKDDEARRAMLIGIYRTFQPTLVIAHAPNDYHTDHRGASQLAESCSWLCASQGQPVPGVPLKAPPAVWWMDTVGMLDFAPSFFVDVTPQAPVKEQMLACHASQIGRADDPGFVPLLDQMRSQMQTRGRQSGVPAAEAFRQHLALKRTAAW